MIKKMLLIVLCACSINTLTFAQISTGKPTSKIIRTGNRAEAGDFGLYLGATSNMFSDMFDSKVELKAMPLVNLKYMVTDEFELRLGLEFYKTTERLKGESIDKEDEEKSIESSNKILNSTNRIYPGFAYHFAKSNILDVYAGAELPIGWRRDKTSSEYEKDYTKTTKGSFEIGLGAFIGLQAFIADLPLAIGVEYGISSIFETGLKYKHETKIEGKKQTVYAPSLEDLPQLRLQINNEDMFDSLKANKGEIGNQFRITLTYYFK